MKNTIRKVLSLLMALVIMLGTTIGAKTSFAAEDKGTITVTNATNGKKYGAYRIFDLTYSGEGDNLKVSYTVNEEWKTFFNKDEIKDKYIKDNNDGNLNPIVIDGSVKYINITDSNVAEFAKAALAEIENDNVNKVAEETATNDTVSFTNLPLGYYLIHPQGASESTDTTGSIVSLTSTTPNGQINAKATYPTITKKVDKKTQDLNKDVEFTIESKVPDTTGYKEYTFEMTDTLSKGLKFKEDTLKVKFGEDEEVQITNDNSKPYYYTVEDGADGKTILKIIYDMKKLQDKKGNAIKVTYSATITKDANIGNKENTNNVILEYSRDPKNKEEKEKVPTPTVKVYTGKINIVKIEKGKADKKLAGAQFVLKNEEGKFYKQYVNTKEVTWVDENEATILVTDQEGKAEFSGIKAGKYFLKEVKAPEGYNKLTEEKEFVLSADDDNNIQMEAESDVENSTGVQLPKVGGMGTKIFTLIGGIVILYAGLSLIKSKRQIER